MGEDEEGDSLEEMLPEQTMSEAKEVYRVCASVVDSKDTLLMIVPLSLSWCGWHTCQRTAGACAGT